MLRNRIALVLTALLAAASATLAKPTLRIIPKRVVFTSLLQNVDVRVQLPASDPAFSGYVSVIDTSNFASLTRYGVAISLKPGEDRVVRIPLPGPQFNPPTYHAELSANRDLSKFVAYTNSKQEQPAFVEGSTAIILGGNASERQSIMNRLRNLHVPLTMNGYNGVATYASVKGLPQGGAAGTSPSASMMGPQTIPKLRVLVPRSSTDVSDGASVNFGRAIAVAVLPGVSSPDIRKALQVYADFGGIVIDAAQLNLRNTHGTVIPVSGVSDVSRVLTNTDDLARRYVAAQSGHVFISAGMSDREILSAPELKSPSSALIFVLLALYTLVAIPVLYFVLKRSGKRELAWVALPGIAAGFTGIFGIMGAMNRPAAPFAQHRELIAGTLNSPNVRSQETFSIYNGATKQVLLDVPSRGATTIANGSITADGRVSGFVNVPQWAMATTSVDSPTYDLGGSVMLSRLPNGDYKVTNNTTFTLSGASLGRRLGNNVSLGGVLNPGQTAIVSQKELQGAVSPGQPSFDVGWGFTLNDQIENGYSDAMAVLGGSDYYFKARINDTPSSIRLDGKPLKIVRSQRMLFLRCSETANTILIED
ncbi:MAG: hypothetical protein RLZ42_1228 [Armatimonadota bacterium]